MQKKSSHSVAVIGGAFKDPAYLWRDYLHIHNAQVVGGAPNQLDGITGRATAVLDEIKSLNSPVYLCGHSLGALIAYRVAQEAPEGLVLGTALVCPAMLGGVYTGIDVSVIMQMVFNPFGYMRQLMMLMPERPESLSSLLSGVLGDIPVGRPPENLLAVAGSSDILTTPPMVRMVAERTGATFMEVPNMDHALPETDRDGTVLEAILKRLRNNA